MDTPVPMPNTEVKHRSGDDSRKRQKQHAASLSGPQGDSFFLPFFPEALRFHRRGEGTGCIHTACECRNPIHTVCEQEIPITHIL